MNSLAKLYQRPLDFIDRLLDGLTSYRLVLYFLLALLGWAILISFDKKLPYTWHAILLSAALLVVVCRAFGELFARGLGVARNFESDYITALILTLIMIPAVDARGFAALAGAGVAAIASKYILTIGRQHIFNPAAAGAFISGAVFHHYAGWWIGTALFVPLVIVGGLLIMRKMKRFYMIAIFTLVYGLFLHQQFDGAPPLHTVWLAASGTGVMFFAFIMLIEPLTSPDALIKYLPYSVVVGVAYGFTKLHLSPEEALLIGNVVAYGLVRGKRLELRMSKAVQEAEGIYSFLFEYHGTFDFKPGQYLEWTLPLAHSDQRGNRRYLTLSSSPTENQLMFTVRMPRDASFFKKALATFKLNDRILASHLSGSFTLPSNGKKKLAFIAGGIGVTPFRSMIKYLVDKRQTRDISLLYAASKQSQIAFSELFDHAKSTGLKTNYIETAASPLKREDIVAAMPDYKERLFYLSGPYGFVAAAREDLLDLGVGLRDIKSDYFPGYN